MAIYASPEEMVAPHSRTNRWTFAIILTAFLTLIYFLQSEEAAERFVALQDVVVKSASIRGIANRTGFPSFQDEDISEQVWNDDDYEEEANDDTAEEVADDDAVMAQDEVEEDITEGKKQTKVNDSRANNKPFSEAAKEDEKPVTSQAEGDVTSKTTDEKQKDDKLNLEQDNDTTDIQSVDEEENGETSTLKAAEKDESETSTSRGKTDTPPEDTATKDKTVQESENECASMCMSREKEQKVHWGGDLLDITEVERLAKEQYDKLIDRLKNDYGEEYFTKIFEVDGKSRGRSAFLSANKEDGISLQRFKRKLKMKLLSVQLSVESERDTVGECDCKVGAKLNSRSLESNEMSPLADHHERFVWATGGHSSAAGHGNLFNQSYTAVMEKALVDIFGSIGIEFEARAYAMGGTPAAPEIALCNEAIFGTDPDVLSWDFGMLDGRIWDRKGMYSNRGAGLNPNRPAIFDMFIDKFVERRVEEIQKIEERGLTGLYMNPDVFDEMKNGIPDTFGLNSEQINALPRFVRHFKCQDALEKGDPTCDDMKYDNKEVCPDRKGMASWHPGWKLMALWGNTMALFLSETLLDAIAEIGPDSDRGSLLRHLETEENIDYQKFSKSDLPDLEGSFLTQIGDELLNETDVSIFFRSPSICHTARLPAETRYLGILTESDKLGVDGYDKGIPKNVAEFLTGGDDSVISMPLVYDPAERQSCEFELNRDYKDFFYASNKMSWSSLTIPNKAEAQAYGKDPDKYKYHGLLVMCIKSCDWGRCPSGDMQLESIQKGQVQFEVNDIPVTNVTKFLDCGVLRGEQGHSWKPNADGQYTLKAKVLRDRADLSYIRISSLILL